MIRQNKTPLHHWVERSASLVLFALAASGCGSDSSSEDGKARGVATLPSNAEICAANPRALQCTNPADISGMPPTTGAAGAAPAVGARPATPTSPAAPATPPGIPPSMGTGIAGAAAPPATPPGQAPSVPGQAPSAPGAPPPGAGATPPPSMGAAGAPPAGGAAGGAAPAGANLAGISDEELNALRQACVDEINMYRATLTMNNLKPMKRASPKQEECSDRGAQMDGDSGQAHGAARAGLCQSVGLFAENTCPGWPVGGRNGTLTDSMKNCLKSMWGEGEPPVSRAECQKDYQGCFLKYGHYLNMSDPGNLVASCGFYKMKNGAYWMNQDFAAR